MTIRELENFRKENKITTREFAKMCGMTPAKYCDIKFCRIKPNIEEWKNIIDTVNKIKKDYTSKIIK